ncbi:hypothetical protein JDV02_000082 [Purpureocillium takamizusanense]|uniref:Uncharacterized protein n=1 Tax=Purpureocillium takamizusanense TaxID=2060973 RepID=A0A9Q8V6H3_9HYPO|nr:uncharacterized protein JDV02_000082 [Purpureocillium takamizusanense]UNI13326.1 hypothetical protein JDV02_000082 [Purpureocillium takamizusanense]
MRANICIMALLAASGLGSAGTASFRRADVSTHVVGGGLMIECNAPRHLVPKECFPPYAKCEQHEHKYSLQEDVYEKYSAECFRLCRCTAAPNQDKKQSQATQASHLQHQDGTPRPTKTLGWPLKDAATRRPLKLMLSSHERLPRAGKAPRPTKSVMFEGELFAGELCEMPTNAPVPKAPAGKSGSSWLELSDN